MSCLSNPRYPPIRFDQILSKNHQTYEALALLRFLVEARKAKITILHTWEQESAIKYGRQKSGHRTDKFTNFIHPFVNLKYNPWQLPVTRTVNLGSPITTFQS